LYVINTGKKKSSNPVVGEEGSVSDGTADVVDVVYVNMELDLWGAFGLG
jgi:hypothetical protein